MKAVRPQDYRALARRRLPPFLFEYIDGGCFSEQTMDANEADLRKVRFRQPVLRKVAEVDLTTSWFGQSAAMPVILGPVGIAGMNARRGEVQAARAAKTANIPFVLSNNSVCPIEEVARDAGRGFWFQAYMIRDRGFMKELLARASAAGCRALVFTVDVPVTGPRYRDHRTGLTAASSWRGSLQRTLQALSRPRWSWDVALRGRPLGLGNMASVLAGRTGLEDYFGWVARNFDPTVTWSDLDFLRAHWDGPFLLKGILDVADAKTAVSIGASGIVVSNHGGRQLDGVSSTAAMLAPIVDAVGDSLTVMVDGGMRSGLDVVRMLALGAKAVLLGRAWVFALGTAGETGVAHLLRMIEAEMRVVMTLLGCTSVADLDRSLLLDYPRV